MGDSIVLSAYFTGRPDPQRACSHPPDCDDLLGPWHQSLMAVGLEAVVFHDGLSEEFTRRYVNDHVTFERYEPVTEWSINDERFLCWLRFLESRPELEWILLTDLFDVEFRRDPFALMRERRDVDLFAGDDRGQRLGAPDGVWMRHKMLAAYGRIVHEGRTKLIGGTIGGRRRAMLELLRQMVAEFRRLGSSRNLNMPVFNRCAHDAFGEGRILSGAPFTSRFRSFERKGDFCLRHK